MPTLLGKVATWRMWGSDLQLKSDELVVYWVDLVRSTCPFSRIHDLTGIRSIALEILVE